MGKVRGYDAWGNPVEVDEPEDLLEEFEGKTEFGEQVIGSLPRAEYSDAEYQASYDEAYPSMAALRPDRGTQEAPTVQQTKALSEIAKQRGKPILGDEVRERMRTGDFETLDLGGTSEKLAKQEATGVYEVPTDESLNLALANAFPKFQRRIRGNPTFGALQWEQPGAAGGGAQQTADPADVPSLATWEMPSAAPTEDEYGWGFKKAFQRGLVRAGQLVDLATGDVEEYAEGAAELQKYAVSEEDEKRLEELRATNGFWKGLGYYIANPSLAMQVVLESLPMSAPTLVGAASGAMLAGPAGAIAGGATGSGVTEYLATIGDALSKAGIDPTDAEAVKKAFADPKFMAEAREDAIERGIGVAIFDGLSIGLAGKIYQPVKSLAKTSTKTGAVLGGTSEILAQGFAGAGGEGAAQILDVGRIEDPTALSGEFVGELVPGLGEMAISKIGKKTPAERDVPDTGTGGTTPLPPTGPGGVPITEEEAAAIDAEAEPRKREPKPPPSEAKTATTPPTETKETAPTPQEEEVPIEELLASAAKKEEAAYQEELEAKDKEEAEFEKEAAKEEEFVSPLVNTKTLGPKIGSTITSAEAQKPVRDAWRNLMQTLAKRYPETTATVPKSRFSGTGIAKFLKTLQDEVDLTTDIPEINELITQISEQEQTADIINVLDRLSSKIRGETPSLADAPIGSVSAAVQAAYNDFVEYYETHQRVSKAKKTKGQVTLKGSSIAMANKLGEMAAATRELLTAAYEAGVLEEAGIGAEYGKTIQIALEAADAAQAPFEKRTKGGGKTKGIAFARDTLFKNAQNLKDIAEKVTPLLAEVEAKVAKARAEGKPLPPEIVARKAEAEAEVIDSATTAETVNKQKKGKGKAKVEPRSAVTEASAKPKKAEKAKKVSKQKAEEKPATVKELRARAKELNIAGRWKMTKYGLQEAIKEAEQAPKEVKVTTAKEKKAEAAKKVSRKKAKKPDVKGAKPEEVFDKKQNITGREAGEIQESVDAKNLDEAFEIAGVTKESATRIRGAMGSLDEAGKRALTDAAYEFARKKDPIRFATQLQEILEKTPSPELMEAYTEFYMEINERKAERIARQQEEVRARQEDATSFLSEDDRAIAELTGAIEPEYIDPDETVVDEYGVPLSARLRKIFEPNDSLTPAEKARFRVDSRILARVVGRITKRLLASTKSSLVENPDKLSMQEMIDLLLEGMPKNHRFAHLLKLLKRTNVDMEVILHDNAFGIDEYGRTAGVHRPGRDADGKFNPDTSRIELVFDMENRSEANFVKTALHEMIHAVTVARYMVDKRFARHIDQLYLQAIEKFRQDYSDFPDIQQLMEEPGQTPQKVTAMVKEYLSREQGLGEKYYGLANPLEFMAEAFTNPYFQEFLGGIQLEASPELLPNIMRTFRATARLTGLTSILEGFLNAVKKVIGISRRNTVLEEVITSTTVNFDTNLSLAFSRGKFRTTEQQSFPSEDQSTSDKALVNETADLARQRNKQVKQTYEALKEGVQGLPRAINLGFMNRDVIERNYRELFARASKAAGYAVSPLTKYIKAKQAASQLAEEFALKASDALKALQKFDTKTRSQVFTLMRDTTMAQVWPHVSLQDKMNDHLWTKPNKKTGVRKLKKEYGEKAKAARKKWVALNKQNPAAAQLLIKMAKLTQEIQNRKRIEALQATGKTYKVPEAVMKKLIGLETKEDIQKMFPGMYDKQGDLVPADTEKVRPADTIIEDGDTKSVRKEKRKKLEEWQKLRNIAQTAEEIIKGSTIQGPYFPLRRYGKYVVSSTDDWNSVKGNKPYVSFHNTKAEARRVAAAIEKEYGIPTYRSKKIEDMSVPSSVETVTAELARRVGTNRDGVTDEMSRRLKTAMIEIMADNTAYASQLKRMNVDGVAADDMGRAFEEYVFVTKYTLGDLATSHEVHQALKDLKKLQKSEDLSDADLDLIGDVVNEIAKQNKEDAKDREMSAFQKGVGLIGFFNFLGAPSYWVLNATQTLTVTLPYIGSKWGAKGTAAYMESAKTVLAAAKNAKSYEQFKSNLPESAQLVVAELEKQGIIQSTIAHQFGDIMNPSTLTKIQDWAGPVGKATATALKLMETIPEGVEKYNRISTALAVYNLSGGSIVQTADAVQATQFNYDSANRARLMKAAPKWAGGGLRAIITPAMMFKSYGIGLTRLLYGGMLKAVMTKRPHETAEQAAARRQEGRRIAGGLIVSHTFFGGVAGGIMMAPVQGLVSVFNEVFREAGDEFDPDEAVELYLQDVANDTVAALVSRGVPAALGVDMSKSINLGNLLWMGNDRINLGDAGGVETALTTALGPVAQYGITTVREGARIWNEDPRANWYDFLAAAMPVKALKGAVRGAKYEFTGIGTDTLTFVDRDDVTGWMRMALGFRPTNVAMTTDYEYNLMAREARQSRRKSTLVDRALKAETAAEKAVAWKEIDNFNRSIDARRDRITKGDVVRLRSRRRSRQRKYDRERR